MFTIAITALAAYAGANTTEFNPFLLGICLGCGLVSFYMVGSTAYNLIRHRRAPAWWPQ